jgi:aspartate dehydrogenase
MKKKVRIGIVGCGAIGTSLAKAIIKNFSGQTQLAGLYDIDQGKSARLSVLVSKGKKIAVASLKELINKSDLVIEAAHANSSWDIARKALGSGRDIMIMSVGGIVAHHKKLEALAYRNNAHVFVPSGAISGVDALKAASFGRIKKVTLTTRKNPLSFKGVDYVRLKKIDLGSIRKEKTIFSGTASQAMKYFPQNINVAGVLSIAGIGKDKTSVRIIADPDTSKNIHQIDIESDAANISTRTENVLHPQNPKTSFLAVLSAVATLRQILEPVRVGT